MPNGLTLKIHKIKNYPQNKEKANKLMTDPSILKSDLG